MQIAIVLYPGFTALGFIGPDVAALAARRRDSAGGTKPGPIAADSGILPIGATHTFDETPSPDLILVPGGFSTMEHARDEVLLDWLRRARRTHLVDHIGVLGFDDLGRGGSAHREARHLALGGPARAQDNGRDTRERRADRAGGQGGHAAASRPGIDLGCGWRVRSPGPRRPR